MKEVEINACPLNASPKLLASIGKVIMEGNVNSDVSNIVINFRDCSYSSKDGGYHPVEISLQREQRSGLWNLLYITDFCYCGHPFAELCKDLDFDFSAGTFFSIYSPPIPITHKNVREVFKLWQSNFLSYLEYDAFDQINLSIC